MDDNGYVSGSVCVVLVIKLVEKEKGALVNKKSLTRTRLRKRGI